MRGGNMYQILIVDDDQNYRYAIRSILNWNILGFAVRDEAINGRQALRKLQENRFDLVITDMSMPLMNGVELIKEAKVLFPDLIFLALSAYDDFEFVKESMKSGAADYILKYEMSEESLTSVICSVREKLDKRRKEERVRQLLENTGLKRPEMKRAVLYMQENYSRHITLQEIADHVGLNKNYFSNLFKEETGENFVRFLNKIRIAHACVLIEQDNLKLYEIAEQVGYNDTGYFGKVFREVTGLSIEEYKNKISVNNPENL